MDFDDDSGESGDDSGGRSGRFKNWAEFGNLRNDIEEAWQNRSDTSCESYEVVLVVTGNNPISGYSVRLKPIN
jgi:hypothetical protein